MARIRFAHVTPKAKLLDSNIPESPKIIAEGAVSLSRSLRLKDGSNQGEVFNVCVPIKAR
jgi:hypothetical protein